MIPAFLLVLRTLYPSHLQRHSISFRSPMRLFIPQPPFRSCDSVNAPVVMKSVHTFGVFLTTSCIGLKFNPYPTSSRDSSAD